MALTKEELQMVVKAVDDASATFNAIKKSVDEVGGQAAVTSEKVEGLGGKLTSVGTILKGGFIGGLAFQAGQDIFSLISNAVGTLVQQIPDAIRVGDQWVTTVHDLMVVSGLGATQASLLAAEFQTLGIPIDSTSRILAMFSRNLGENLPLLNKLGIATVDASGKQLDAYTILNGLREKFSQFKGGLEETAAAQELLGRSGYELLPFLQLTNAQLAELNGTLENTGLVLSDDVVQKAHAFNIELSLIGDLVQGAQTKVFAGLLPSLTSFVSAFAGFLQQHLSDIVAFVVNAANFVMGVIGGIFGIDFKAISLGQVLEDLAGETAKQSAAQGQLSKSAADAAKGEDALTKSIKAQISAIDDQIKAIDEREAKRHASDQRAGLQDAINQAQSQLNDLLGNSPYLNGLSAGEAELATQDYNQKVVDARKALSDAIAKLASFDADQADDAEKQTLENKKTSLQNQLTAHQQASTAMAASSHALAGSVNTDFKSIEKQVTASFGKLNSDAQTWRDNGVAFAKTLQGAIGGVIDTLLGSEVSSTVYGPHDEVLRTVTSRQGGLVGALQALGGMFGWLGSHASDAALGFRVVMTAASQFGPVLEGVAKIIRDVLRLDFNAAAQDEQNLARDLARAASNAYTGHAMGGYIPPGGTGRVGEYAPEIIRARAGGGVDVSPYAGGANPTESSSGAAGGDVYLDGYKVGQVINRRRAKTHRSTTIRPVGAT